MDQPPGTGVPPSMQGFGSEDMTAPFNYGSVRDGQFRQDSLEHKLKKKYWKTKQTVTEKLGKTQDEFVVAGDTDIDTKLEKAYHLKSSCVKLLQALNKYATRMKEVSAQESVMGQYLRTWSETEYTNAGEVMQNVGKLQESMNKIRLNMVPALMRMYSEFAVFQNTALRDLSLSIQQLEKARTEYRAALLWMKDVSEKLENPDYRNQLARFREAQATVKETKERYDKMKHDLGEKIDMVSASRCNLLSRSLPNYQKEVLLFNDMAANEFHKILVDLRSHHHHQYKVRRLAEEIRDLEAEESPFAEEPDMLGARSPTTPRKADDDEPLLDVSKHETQTEKPAVPKPVGDDLLTLEKVAQEAKVNDLTLSGQEAELRNLQDELLQPSNGSTEQSEAQPTASNMESTTAPESNESEGKSELDDLLQLADNEIESAAAGHQAEPQKQSDQIFDEWSNFSAFMPSTRSEPTSPTSGWEREFLNETPTSGDPLDTIDSGLTSEAAEPTSADQTPPKSKPGEEEKSSPENAKESEIKDVDELLGISEKPKETKEPENTLLSDDLKSLGLGPPVKTDTTPRTELVKKDPMSIQSLDSSYFSPPQYPPPGVMGQQGQPPMFRSPLSASSGPIFPPGMMPVQQLPGMPSMMAPGGLPQSGAGGDRKMTEKKGKDQDKASTSWMNVFAHLDPLVNEKA